MLQSTCPADRAHYYYFILFSSPAYRCVDIVLLHSEKWLDRPSLLYCLGHSKRRFLNQSGSFINIGQPPLLLLVDLWLPLRLCFDKYCLIRELSALYRWPSVWIHPDLWTYTILELCKVLVNTHCAEEWVHSNCNSGLGWKEIRWALKMLSQDRTIIIFSDSCYQNLLFNKRASHAFNNKLPCNRPHVYDVLRW